MPVLILCDFDGTVTTADTNSYLSERFAPHAFATVEGLLAGREMSLREVLAAELGEMTQGPEVIIGTAVRDIPLRAGFREFVDRVEAEQHHLVLLSAGFRQVIEPMLSAAGFGAEVRLIANDVEFTPEGGRITWRELPTCARCGEPCKRHDVDSLRARHRDSHPDVVYIGDGFSDRCGAEAADRIFARAALARYLDDIGHAYEPFETFHEITDSLWP